jgi:hypothetical protein
MLISDFELAWHHGTEPPSGVAFVVKYIGEVRVRFYLRQHIGRLKENAALTWSQVAMFQQTWPGIHRGHVDKLIEKMT